MSAVTIKKPYVCGDKGPLNLSVLQRSEMSLSLICVSGRQTGGGQDPQQPAISCDKQGVSQRSS